MTDNTLVAEEKTLAGWLGYPFTANCKKVAKQVLLLWLSGLKYNKRTSTLCSINKQLVL